MLLSLPLPTPSREAAVVPELTKKRSNRNLVTRTTCRLFLRPQQHHPDQDFIDAALVRAKAAVQYDADGQLNLAIEAYAETIGLLCQVQQDPTPAIQHIHAVYADRIVTLSTRESTETQGGGEKHDDWEIDHYRLHHWTLLKKIKQSMIFGGHITGRLYVPKELWHQPLTCLPDLNKKLALAEYLLTCLKATRHYHAPTTDPELVIQELLQLRHALLTDPSNECEYPLTQQQQQQQQQTKKGAKWLKWSKKPVVVVDRVRHMSGLTLDDRYPMYIRTLIKVFSTAQFLDTWYHEYSDLVASAPSSGESAIGTYQRVLHEISTCAETLGRIVSTTVMTDFHLLWDAWVTKGNHYWMD